MNPGGHSRTQKGDVHAVLLSFVGAEALICMHFQTYCRNQ